VQYQIFQVTLEKFGKDTATAVWDQALTYGHFNLHDSSLIHRAISKTADSNQSFESFADYCLHHNIGLLAAAPLSMGLLTHNGPPEWHPAIGSKLEYACKVAAEICAKHHVDIATLAIVYAISHPNIPSTILGMKNVEQVETAAALARRLSGVNWTLPGLKHIDVLQQVLTEPERIVFDILRDKTNGPFSQLASDDTSHGTSAPSYQWNGIDEAHKFWQGIDGATIENWQLKTL
jgi:hypothetical protein